MSKGARGMDDRGKLRTNSSPLVPEIRKLNVSFLNLARKLLISGRSDAMASLGISQEMADVLVAMPAAEIANLANTNLLLCRFYFGSHVLAELIAKPHWEELAVPEAALALEVDRTAVGE